MNKADLLTMNQTIDLIAEYKGKVIPDDLFDAMVALLKKVNISRLATHVVDDLAKGLTNTSFTLDSNSNGIEALLTVGLSVNSALYDFLCDKNTIEHKWDSLSYNII